MGLEVNDDIISLERYVCAALLSCHGTDGGRRYGSRSRRLRGPPAYILTSRSQLLFSLSRANTSILPS